MRSIMTTTLFDFIRPGLGVLFGGRALEAVRSCLHSAYFKSGGNCGPFHQFARGSRHKRVAREAGASTRPQALTFY